MSELKFKISPEKFQNRVSKSSSDNALAIIENLPIPILLIDENLTIKFANLYFYETFKLNEFNTQGKKIAELENGQWNIPILNEAIREAFKGVSSQSLEVAYNFYKIGSRTIVIYANKIEIDSNQIVLLAIEDVTKREQQAFKKIYDRLSLALDAGQIGTWEYDPDLDVVLCDARLLDIYGLYPSHFHDNFAAWMSRVHPEDFEIVERKFSRLVTTGTALDIDFRIIHPFYEYRYVRLKAKALVDEKTNNRTIIGVTLDVTEEELLKTSLFNEKEKLINMINERDQINKELESFAYIASHDLKAPLRGIESLATWIEKDKDNILSDESKGNLVLLHSRVNRMSNLIEGILQYSRAGKVNLNVCTVSIKRLLDEIIETLDPPKNVKIEYSHDLPVFKTAKIPLSQVLTNLIANGIKYNNRKDARVTISVKEYKNFFEFTVADNGPGIEPQYHKKIFEIFQSLQSKDTIEGTGIGLSIVKKIVELNHGTITVESSKNKGATFRFTWPKANGR